MTDILYTSFSSVLENYGNWFHSQGVSLVNTVGNVATYGSKNKGGSWNSLRGPSCVVGVFSRVVLRYFRDVRYSWK